MAARISNPFPQHEDINGVPFAGGKLRFFENGTDIPKDVFSDLAGTLPLGNEIILDSRGAWPSFYGVGTYRVRLLNANNVQIAQRDDIVVSTGEGFQFLIWDPSTIYQFNDVVKATDNNYYISIIDPNVNNDPLLANTAWSQITLLETYNNTKTYDINNNVLLNGLLYRSRINNNLNNSPDASPDEWALAVDFSALTAISTLENADTFPVTDDSDNDNPKKISWTDTKTQWITDLKASKAEMESETTNKFPDANILIHHPAVSKIWVNFNGQGTPSIRDSFNVSSITDLGTGIYRLNFSQNMQNVNYCVVSAYSSNNSSGGVQNDGQASPFNYQVGAVSLTVPNGNADFLDRLIVNTAIFGDLT